MTTWTLAQSFNSFGGFALVWCCIGPLGFAAILLLIYTVIRKRAERD